MLYDISIYAHELEMPYITGKKDYPEGTSEVDESLVGKTSPYFPNESIDLRSLAVQLPDDRSVPGMNSWRWIHSPGHTDGHISLFRDSDRVLIVGDAFTTTKQESIFSIQTENKKIKGPPSYFTEDWGKAKDSVSKLAKLNPSLLIPMHGSPMEGREIKDHLDFLSKHFAEISITKNGNNIKDNILLFFIF